MRALVLAAAACIATPALAQSVAITGGKVVIGDGSAPIDGGTVVFRDGRIVAEGTHEALMAEGVIEIAPIAYMRGRTLNNAYIVIDEAQNCTYVQLKMLLTRLGWHSTMVVTGDPQQSDLLPGISGLADISARLEAVDDIAVVRLAERDIVRHPLVASMIGVL